MKIFASILGVILETIVAKVRPPQPLTAATKTPGTFTDGVPAWSEL
jgi:hypothetical protein